MEQEYFEKTPAKANRWFWISITSALLFGITFSLPSVFNWFFLCLSAYALFLSYFYLPVQPKIFQRKNTFQGGSRSSSGSSAATQASPSVVTAKRIVFAIAGTFFGIFAFLIIVGIFTHDDNDDTSSTAIESPAEGYEEGETSDQPTASSLVSTGNDFFNNQQYDSANKYYEDALALNPNEMEAVYGKGIVLYNQGQTDDAYVHFQRAYDGGFRFSWLSWALGKRFDDRGEQTRAAALYHEALSMDSAFSEIYPRLAEFEPQNRDKYLRLAEKYK